MNGSHPGFGFRCTGEAQFDAFCPETEPHWHQAIAEHSDANLPWREQRKMRAGSVFLDRQFVDADALHRSVFYNEIKLLQNYHSTIHINLVSSPACGAFFGVGRACGQPAFDVAGIDRFRLIMPAFTRAAQMLVECGASAATLDDDFAALSSAAIFCVCGFVGTSADRAMPSTFIAPQRRLREPPVSRGRRF